MLSVVALSTMSMRHYIYIYSPSMIWVLITYTCRTGLISSRFPSVPVLIRTSTSSVVTFQNRCYAHIVSPCFRHRTVSVASRCARGHALHKEGHGDNKWRMTAQYRRSRGLLVLLYVLRMGYYIPGTKYDFLPGAQSRK